MNKYWIPALSLLLLAGCGIPAPRHSIPVVDAHGRPLQGSQQPASSQTSAQTITPAPAEPVSPVQVIAQPTGTGLSVQSSTPQPGSWPTAPETGGAQQPVGVYPMSNGSSMQNSLPGSTSLPAQVSMTASNAFQSRNATVQSLLDLASNQQSSGNITGAMSNLERARLLVPNDPVTLYRLGELHLSQGNPQQAEQMALNALNNAGSNQALTASLWELVARCRDQLGNAAGAAEARQKARVIQ